MDKNPILYVSPLPPPCGGIATWTHLIFKNGLPNRHPLCLVDTKIRSRRNVFDTTHLSLPEIKRLILIITNLCKLILLQRPALIHLSCSLSSVGIFRDVVCALIIKLFRIPLIAHYHGHLPDFKAKRFLGLSGFVLRSLFYLSKLNIVENQLSLDSALQNNRHKIKLRLLPNFVEDSLFELQKQNISRPSSIFKMIFAGGITLAKGAFEILTVAKSLPLIEFHLYGVLHADAYPLYKNKTFPSNLFLHGVIDHVLLLQKMCEADCLLFPSYSEGFPLTVLEAMAIGLPVIGTSVGAMTEMIDEGYGGYLVPVGDIKRLQKSIEQLASNRALATTMGNYNKEKSYRHFRYSRVINELQSIYTELLSEAK